MDFRSARRLFLIVWLCLPVLAVAKDYDIRKYGAVPDGVTLNSKAIQSAIDEASEEGGGRVVIPPGKFLSGTIILKSGVELHIQANATLLGSTDVSHYQKLNRWKGLIMADGAEDIAITGKGVIDGQGADLAMHVDSLFYVGQVDSAWYTFPERRPKEPLRPQIVELVRCKNVRVQGITLRNGASWVQTYDLCENVLINGIKVDSDCFWNNDGIDVTDCKRVWITNCDINSSDDGICIKSYSVAGFLNDSIYISNCRVRSSASAVKFGSAGYGGFRNIVVRNIDVYNTFRSAIALEQVDGGVLENVLVENINAVNTGNAIFLRLGHKYRAVPPGTFRNVVIRNVRVTIPFERPDKGYAMRGPALSFFHNIFPSAVAGIPGYYIENVLFENIEISHPGKGNPAYARLPLWRLETIPEKPHNYPEFSMFGELPAWGFYVRHARGLVFKDIRVRIREADYRPAFVFDDVNGLTLEGIEVKGDNKEEDMFFKDVAR